MNGENVRHGPYTKYLGVILDEHLTFNEHIKKTSFKAHQVRSFLQQNINSCSAKVKEACYLCYRLMARLVIKYASVHTQKQTSKQYSAEMQDLLLETLD